jgi:hypothetical protein
MSNICVADKQDRQIGELVVNSDGEILPKYAGCTSKCEFLSRSVNISDPLVSLRNHDEVIPGALSAFDSLGSGEPSHWNVLAPEACDNTAAHIFVELDAKISSLDFSQACTMRY